MPKNRSKNRSVPKPKNPTTFFVEDVEKDEIKVDQKPDNKTKEKNRKYLFRV